MTRNGKIARLPLSVRSELNQRLSDGESGKDLVVWLNGLPAVRQVMETQFGGRPVTEQNLSEWKQGGYEDWLRHQEAMEFARTTREQAQELTEESGSTPLTDVCSASVSVLLVKLIRQSEQSPETTPATTQELLGLIREWSAVRKGDHQAARLKMRQADWEEAQAKVAEEKARQAAAEAEAKEKERSPEALIAAFDKKYRAIENEVLGEYSSIITRKTQIQALCRLLEPKAGKRMSEIIEAEIDKRQEALIVQFSAEHFGTEAPLDRTESDSIRPNPTGTEENDVGRLDNGHKGGFVALGEAA